MRDYCRVFHTSMDYLLALPMTQLMEEMEDAAAELEEERRQQEKRIRAEKAKAKRKRR